MLYRVMCTFDLYDAESDDYDNVYEALGKIGLVNDSSGFGGEGNELPNTTVVGVWSGDDDMSAFKSAVRSKLEKVFKSLGVEYKYLSITAPKSESSWRLGWG